MTALVDQIRRRGLWQVATMYGLASLAVVLAVWGGTAVLDLSVLYVRLTAVFAFMGFPMALGLAWALREPQDPDGKGFVARD